MTGSPSATHDPHDLVEWWPLLFPEHCGLPADPAELDRLCLPGGAGVAVLLDERDRLLLLTAAASLRRVLAPRLESPDAGDTRRTRLGGVARSIWWRRTSSQFETAMVHHQLARLLNPKGYRKELLFSPSWFVRLDCSARFPRWVVDSDPYGKTRSAESSSGEAVFGGAELEDVVAGPFVTRRRAARLVETLEDCFDLCREHHILAQYPDGVPCAYAEMGRCPAPCNASIPLEEYRQMLADSAEFAEGQVDKWVEYWTRQMEHAAGELAFERAQSFKRRIDRARAVAKDDQRLARTPDALRFLVLQRGRARKSIQAILFAGYRVHVLPEVQLERVGEFALGWLELANSSDKPVRTSYHIEQCWLASHFLRRTRNATFAVLELGPSTQEDAVMDAALAFVQQARPDNCSLKTTE